MSPDELKALKEVLETEINKSKNVFIIGHNKPDFDSVASCIGLSEIVKNLEKKAYIIMNDPITELEPGVKRIYKETKRQYNYITNDDIEKFYTPNTLLIVSDVNKKNMISIGEKLEKFSKIIVIDHHMEDENTIKTENKFISMESSSASEIVTRLLSVFKIKYSKKVANYLLTGISLDTKRFKQNTTAKTHDVAERLIDNGAEVDYVNSLFLEDLDSYRRISSLINSGITIETYGKSLAPIQVSYIINQNNPTQIYAKEDYAKTADRMMQFIGIDAAFVLGYTEEDVIHISARGGKKVNVGIIMEEMGGGGNAQCAAARIEIPTIAPHISDKVKKLKLIKKFLMSKVAISIKEEQSLENHAVVKVKQINKKTKEE